MRPDTPQQKLRIEAIDRDMRLVRITGHGMLQQHDFRQLFRSLMLHPEFTPEMSLFWDLCDANLCDFNYREFQSLAWFMIPHLPQLPERHAIVVGRELEYGIMRIWQAVAEGMIPKERRLFRNADEAYGWLLSRQKPAGHPISH